MAARSDDMGGGQKGGGALRIVGVVVLALAAIGFGAVRMGFVHLPGSSSDDTVLAGKPGDATPLDATKLGSPVKGTPAKPVAGTNDAPDLDAPAAEPPATGSAATTP